MRYTEEKAKERLFRNGFEVGEINERNEKYQKANSVTDIRLTESHTRIIKIKQSIGIKLRGAVDYLVNYCKFQVIFVKDNYVQNNR
jgi:hypothetical protein